MTSVEHARSLLFVPGDRPERFDKAAASGADLVVLDLEDAVAPTRKEEARDHVTRWIRSAEHPVVVRINGAGTTGHDDDVAALAGTAALVMLPKAEAGEHLTALAGRIGANRTIALVETAQGVRDVERVCTAPGVVRVALGTVDLGAELGIDHTSRTALLHVRSRIVLASAAAALPPPVDGVTVAIRDQKALDSDLAHAAAVGFGAKLCIHPSQVAAVNLRFVPDDAVVDWAERVLATPADEAGVLVVDGAMVDAPVLRRARAVIARVASYAATERT